MQTNVEALLGMVGLDDPFDYDLHELRALQLAAANERFQAGRGAVAVLERRAAETEVASIETLSDVVPLLFAHTAYKSYPDAVVRNRRWDTLAKWLDTLSTQRGVTEVEFDGVETIDDWIARLREAGHVVSATSGTTGKCSLFNRTGEDVVGARQRSRLLTWSTGLEAEPSRPVFILLPRRSTYRTVESFRAVAEEFGRPGSIHWMSDESMLMADINRMGALRQAIATGTAKPSDVAAFESDFKERSARMAAEFTTFVDTLVDSRSEPVLLLGLVPQHWDLVQELRARGIASDALHPDSVVWPGGGPKGKDLPLDHFAQIQQVYGVPWPNWHRTYGMTEMNSQTIACAEGGLHLSPWHIGLVLDRSGEHLVEPGDGRVEGRMAFLDVAVSARWGGIISSDNVTMNLNPCACGRRSPTIVKISRYSDDDDEKLTCSGTIDAYVRGMIE